MSYSNNTNPQPFTGTAPSGKNATQPSWSGTPKPPPAAPPPYAMAAPPYAQSPAPAAAPAQQGNPAPPQALPGRNGYTPTTSPYGQDMSNPGVKEQHWDQNQNLWLNGAFAGPGSGQQYWDGVKGSFNQASADMTPQFNAYYDQARNSAVGEVNKQTASRGVYGSSRALNGVNNVIADVEGQRAKASTDFMFNNAANKDRALNTYANIAFGSQAEGDRARQIDLGALRGQSEEAGQAQGARQDRIQGQFNNQMTLAGMYLPWAQQNYDDAFSQDATIMGAGSEADVAGKSAALANSNARRDQMWDDAKNTVGIVGGLAGGGAPGGGAGAGGRSQPTYSYGNFSYSPGQYTPSSGYRNY